MSNPIVRDEVIFVELFGIMPGLVIPVIVDYDQTLLGNTVTPLIIGATYLSTGILVQGYNYITGTCFADQSGTLQWEFSSDGTNYDGVQSFSYTASDPLGFGIPIIAPTLFRIRYTNGAVAQTIFRLYFYGSKTCR